jgi:diguanylate cyclase (GGDEF)-like protein
LSIPRFRKSTADREAAPRRPRGRASWILVALAVFVAGTIGIYVRAASTAHDDSERARLSFHLAASEIASTLRLAIQHEEDLVVSASAQVAANPHLTPAQFDLWASSVHAFARYPELKNIGLVAFVPAARLPAFEARMRQLPLRAFGAGSITRETFQLTPPGPRPYYCLAADGVARDNGTFLPVGLDYCVFARTLIGARDSALSIYAPVMFAGSTALGVETPVYRGGVAPPTVAGRRAAFLGWLGEVIVPGIVLSRALDGHPGTAVTFRYAAAGSHAVFHTGTAPAHATSTTIDLHNGWTVETSAAVADGGVLTHGRSRTVLAGGTLLCALLALLIYLLGTGRQRALALVREKTRELSHQAMHDTLTQLPNRALVLDRAAQMLARSARHSDVLAGALFVDVDGFKHVNDNLGHAAGDELLRVIAARLLEVVREQDTVGRLGGDEFVILVESTRHEAAPELLAERVISALRAPVRLGDAGKVFTFTASVGITFGNYGTPDELLRDADLALYAAKAAGKDRYALFEPGMGAISEEPDEVLAAELGTAVLGDQLTLRYRPLLDIAGERVLGAEALLRWHHPRLGLLTADRFLGVADDTGLIVSIGRWALAEACRQGARWRSQGHELQICVRVSGRELESGAFVGDVEAALNDAGLEPSGLTVAVSEATLNRDLAGVSRCVAELKTLGVRVVIDGFGAAYARLAARGDVPADVLKLDDELVAAAGSREDSRELLRAVSSVGRALGVPLTAEGVEFDEPLLRELVGHSAQGFVSGEALSAERLGELLGGRAQGRPVGSTAA